MTYEDLYSMVLMLYKSFYCYYKIISLYSFLCKA